MLDEDYDSEYTPRVTYYDEFGQEIFPGDGNFPDKTQTIFVLRQNLNQKENEIHKLKAEVEKLKKISSQNDLEHLIVLVNESGEELDSYHSSFIPPENSVIEVERSDNIGLYNARWLILSPPTIEVEKGKVQRIVLKAKEE